MCPLPVCEVRIKLGVSGAGRCQQNLRLEILVLAAEAKKAKCQRTHLTDTQATISEKMSEVMRNQVMQPHVLSWQCTALTPGHVQAADRGHLVHLAHLTQ